MMKKRSNHSQVFLLFRKVVVVISVVVKKVIGLSGWSGDMWSDHLTYWWPIITKWTCQQNPAWFVHKMFLNDQYIATRSSSAIIFLFAATMQHLQSLVLFILRWQLITCTTSYNQRTTLWCKGSDHDIFGWIVPEIQIENAWKPTCFSNEWSMVISTQFSTQRFGFIIPIGTSCKRIGVSGSSWKLEIDNKKKWYLFVAIQLPWTSKPRLTIYFDHLLFEPTSKAHQNKQPLDKHSKHTLFFCWAFDIWDGGLITKESNHVNFVQKKQWVAYNFLIVFDRHEWYTIVIPEY